MKGSVRSIAICLHLFHTAPIEAFQMRTISRISAAHASASKVSIAMAQMQQLVAEDKKYFSSELGVLQDQLARLESAVKPTVEEKSEPMDPKQLAELAPVLEMLKGLYEESKEHIAQLNTREKEEKIKFEEKEQQHNDKLALIEARFANHTLSESMHADETATETRLWSYWSGCRERQHRQFHTGLKMHHSTMSKMKQLIDVYEKATSGNAEEAEQAKKDFEKMAPPEIMLFQERRSVVHFCQGVAKEIQAARTELQRDPLELAQEVFSEPHSSK